MTDALIGVVERDVLRIRLIRPLAPVLLRILVGDETSKMLGLSVRHASLVRLFHQALAGIFKQVNAIMRRLWSGSKPLTSLSAWLGRRLVNLLCEVTYANKGVQLEIPEGWR